MKFIEIDKGDAVNIAQVSRITRAENGLAIVHIGLDRLTTRMPYESLLSLLAIDNIGNGPNPTATALVY